MYMNCTFYVFSKQIYYLRCISVKPTLIRGMEDPNHYFYQEFQTSDIKAHNLRRILWISSDEDDQRIFLGFNFSIPRFFWVGKFAKYFFVWLHLSRDLSRDFGGIPNNLKICGSACISWPHSSAVVLIFNALHCICFIYKTVYLILSGNF